MTKWKAVFSGFILTVLVRCFLPHYEFIGLLIIGFLVGYMAHDGILSGFWNATVSGALGTIICSILFILVVTFGGRYMRLFGGLNGFTVSGTISLLAIIDQLITYGITMGITGAVGGALSSKKS